MHRSRLSLAVLLTMVGCAGEPIAYAPWTVPVPDGVPVHEYEATPAAARDAAIELQRDLVITGSGVEPNPLFFFPGYFSQVIAADEAGRIWVLDVGSQQIESFDEHGNHRGTIGRRGQGPGELARASKLTIAGDQLVASDFPQRRLTLWSLDGAQHAEAPIELAQSFVEVAGERSGDLVVSFDTPVVEGTAERFISRLAFLTEERPRYATTPGTRWERLPTDGGGTSFRHESGQGDFAVAADGTVYVTPGDQYQVHAFAPDGAMRWAARVHWPARPYADETKRQVLEDFRERNPELTMADFDWPATEPVIEQIAVDGRGRIWVLPYRTAAELEAEPLRPVDVFSPDGELLYGGRIDELWQTAHGDHVYRLEQDAESGDWQVARYRLQVSF